MSTLKYKNASGEWVKQTITVDAEPTPNSTRPITSGGVYDALQSIGVVPDPYPTEGSTHTVSSGGTYEKLQEKANQSTTYTKTEVDNAIANKAVRYDTAQTLTESNKRQAQANIGLGVGFYIDSDGDLCQYE